MAFAKFASRLALLPILTVGMAGCAVGTAARTAAVPAATLGGRAMGGQQPISGSTVQLYAVGTSGNGSAATPLLSPALVTDSAGSFNLTGKFTCPSGNALIYITASGGDPGLGGGVNNLGIGMMSLLGSCSSVSSLTYITLNEMTTVAAAFALGEYGTGLTNVGYTGDAAGITAAFHTAASNVSITTGMPVTTATDESRINTLADILATCVNSTGPSSHACSTLSNNTGSATDIFGSAQHIAANPSSNVSALFALIPSNAPFQPVPSSAPATLQVTAPSSSGNSGGSGGSSGGSGGSSGGSGGSSGGSGGSGGSGSTPVVIGATTISPAEDTYSDSVSVSLSTTTPGTRVFYTLDGTTPTTHSINGYNVKLTTTTTVKAAAFDTAGNSGPVTTVTYTIVSSSVGLPYKPADGTMRTVMPLTNMGTRGSVTSIAFDAQDNMYYSVFINGNHTYLYKRSPAGVITKLAGNSIAFDKYGDQTDIKAFYIAVDSHGNLFFTQTGYMQPNNGDLRENVSMLRPDGSFVVVAGGGTSTADGPALSHKFYYPMGLAIGDDDTIYVSDSGKVLKFKPGGDITTVVGGGSGNYASGIAGATSPPVGSTAIATWGGDLYVQTIYGLLKLSNGTLSTVIGGGSSCNSSIKDGSIAANSGYPCSGTGVAVIGGNPYVSGYGVIATVSHGYFFSVATQQANDACSQLTQPTPPDGSSPKGGICYPGVLAASHAGELYFRDTQAAQKITFP